jgi:hypothetical protein
MGVSRWGHQKLKGSGRFWPRFVSPAGGGKRPERTGMPPAVAKGLAKNLLADLI